MIETFDAKKVAEMVLGKKAKPTSYKFVLAEARRGHLIGRKVGKEWRFLEANVERWLSGKS